MEGLGQVLLALALIELAFRGLRSRATVGLIALASFVGAADFAYFNDVDRYCNALKTVVVLFTTDLPTATGAAQAVDGNACANEIANWGGVTSTCISKAPLDYLGRHHRNSKIQWRRSVDTANLKTATPSGRYS